MDIRTITLYRRIFRPCILFLPHLQLVRSGVDLNEDIALAYLLTDTEVGLYDATDKGRLDRVGGGIEFQS